MPVQRTSRGRSHLVAVVVAALAALGTPLLAQQHVYKVLATNKTSTMQKEMQEAGDAGFHFIAVMGGETAVGGKEVVVLMGKAPEDKATYSYRVLATNRTSTLQKELHDAAAGGFFVVGQTIFESMMGGKESAAIAEKSSADSSAVRYEYKLVATSKTSTLQKELQQVADEGFEAVRMTVGRTAVGGSELVVITRRVAK